MTRIGENRAFGHTSVDIITEKAEMQRLSHAKAIMNSFTLHM